MKGWEEALGEIGARAASARSILIASDFDGTLCPPVDSPSEAQLAPEVVATLRRLVAREGLQLAIVTGRAIADVRDRVPVDVVFAGNNGLEVEGGGLSFTHSKATGLGPELQAISDALMRGIRPWPGAWVENKGLSATLHYRAVPQDGREQLLLCADSVLAAHGNGDFRFALADQAVDMLPNVAWDKGSTLEYICQHLGPYNLVICIGDAISDEPMFRANTSGLNLRVGFTSVTAAEYCLPAHSATHLFLLHLEASASLLTPTK